MPRVLFQGLLEVLAYPALGLVLGRKLGTAGMPISGDTLTFAQYSLTEIGERKVGSWND